MRRHLPTFLLSLFVVAGWLAMPAVAFALTLAHWNFNQGVTGEGFDFPGGIPVEDQSGNGNTIFGFDDTFSPHYSIVGDTPTGVGLSSRHIAPQDGFTHPCCSAALNAWEPEQWTIETAFKLDAIDGFRTMISRDGGSFLPAGDFYLQVNAAAGGVVRLDFATVAGPRVGINSTLVPTPGEWYRVAATSDNIDARLWIDRLDGNGWLLEGVAAIPGATATDRALSSPNANWTFGRGWFNGAFVDHITGNLDDIRFSDEALVPGQFIPEPASGCLLGIALVALMGMRTSSRSHQ